MNGRPLALPDQHDPFDEDVSRYLLGELDPPGVLRLQHALVMDAAAREKFIHLASMHGILCELGSRIALGAVDSAKLLAVVRPLPPIPAAAPSRRRSWLTWSTVAAAALVLGVALTTLAQVHQRTRPMVPTIIASAGSPQLIRDAVPLPIVAGTRLRPGDIIRTSDGSSSISIELHGGTFTMHPGSEAIINITETGSRQITLLGGTVVAHMRSSGTALCVLANRNAILIHDAKTTIVVDGSRTSINVEQGIVELRREDGSERMMRIGTHHIPPPLAMHRPSSRATQRRPSPS